MNPLERNGPANIIMKLDIMERRTSFSNPPADFPMVTWEDLSALRKEAERTIKYLDALNAQGVQAEKPWHQIVKENP